jgi:hypothetical protein
MGKIATRQAAYQVLVSMALLLRKYRPFCVLMLRNNSAYSMI